ncbi:MAG: DUF2244 domain-containing protein [Rhodospirillales bacterium]|nr:DUF2244 domain-containing protein [Rhodospirillales bacterium]
MSEAEVLFQATIVPRRSLTRKGATIVLGGFAALGALGALRFLVLGVWPVLVWMAAEAALAALLLALHVRAARAGEMLLLEPDRMRILRRDARGRRSETSLPAAWLNPVLEQAPGRVPRLLLTSHGKRVEVAALLGEAEKRELAAAIAGALRHLREPRFDNPQLRD